MKSKGFTLLEVMIVIGIIAIITAISAVALRGYKTKAQIASIMPTIDKIKNSAIEYYSINGVFPDAAHLGYNSDQALLTDPSVISPLLSDVYIISTAYNDEGYTCTSNFGEMWFFFDPNKVSAGDGLFDFGLYIYYADIDGVVIVTAADDGENGHQYVENLVNPTYPDRDSLFLAAGCTII